MLPRGRQSNGRTLGAENILPFCLIAALSGLPSGAESTLRGADSPRHSA
jgi:hypothetical protein